MTGKSTIDPLTLNVVKDSPIFSPDYTWTNNGDNRHVESFDLQTEEWSSEPPFPFMPVGRSTNIPYGNSFLSIGGTKSDNEAVDYIYTVNGHNNDPPYMCALNTLPVSV